MDTPAAPRRPIRSFRDLDVYVATYNASIEVITKIVPNLPREERDDLVDQLRRAAKAIPRLIAEGYSKKHQVKGFQKYLDDALAESNEMIVSMCHVRDLYSTYVDPNLSQRLLDEFGGQVPDDIDTLTTFNGVGRKTANQVRAEGYGIPAICVDTHVHRISNRWGYVKTRNPLDTEMALRKKLPGEYWIAYNPSLVALGQHRCKPTSPMCSQCPVAHLCPHIGVQRQR